MALLLFVQMKNAQKLQGSRAQSKVRGELNACFLLVKFTTMVIGCLIADEELWRGLHRRRYLYKGTGILFTFSCFGARSQYASAWPTISTSPKIVSALISRSDIIRRDGRVNLKS